MFAVSWWVNVVRIFDLIVNLWLGLEMVYQKIWAMLLMNGSAGIPPREERPLIFHRTPSGG